VHQKEQTEEKTCKQGIRIEQLRKRAAESPIVHGKTLKEIAENNAEKEGRYGAACHNGGIARGLPS